MLKHIAALAFIFFCTSIGWMALGLSIEFRSRQPVVDLKSKVESTWGSPHEQKAPSATYVEQRVKIERITENGKTVEKAVPEDVIHALPLEKSGIQVDFELEHRQKGLLWFSTYRVRFAGTYVFKNATDRERQVEFTFPYPASPATYDGLVFMVDGAPAPNLDATGKITGRKLLRPGEAAEISVSYGSQGLDRWTYNFGGEPAHVREFNLDMTTNFTAIDFPQSTLSPVRREQTPNGWKLNWNYSSLLTSYTITMEMPQKLQPGPLAGQISFFAPVSLFFFFFIIFMITTIRGIDLQPMNYFFLAAAFFAFHLLLAYLVDHLSIHLSFVICSAVSIFLVISYLRLVVNMRFALVEAGLAQFIYLVLFSYAFFFKGFTGLTITIGSILTLFAVMQATAKFNWEEKFGGASGRPSRNQNLA